MQVVLYVDGFFTNQWDGACLIALEEKGVPYTTARALLRDGGGVPPELPRRTGIPRIPTLSHGEFWISESHAIVEYLEEAFPPPEYPALFPRDPESRARTRQQMAFARSALWALREERSFWMCLYPASPPPLSPAAEADIRELLAFVQHVVDRGELASWTIGHADLALCLLRLDRTGYELPPSAARLLDASLARRSVRAFLEHARPPHPPAQAYSEG